MIKVAITVMETDHEQGAALVHVGAGQQVTVENEHTLLVYVSTKNALVIEETSTAPADPDAIVLSDGVALTDGGC